jgi:hypothetical protein
MDRQITRRDFLNGMNMTIGAAIVPPAAIWGESLGDADDSYAPEKRAGYYPPTKTGMRGSHDGSWEVAHEMRDGKKPIMKRRTAAHPGIVRQGQSSKCPPTVPPTLRMCQAFMAAHSERPPP